MLASTADYQGNFRLWAAVERVRPGERIDVDGGDRLAIAPGSPDLVFLNECAQLRRARWEEGRNFHEWLVYRAVQESPMRIVAAPVKLVRVCRRIFKPGACKGLPASSKDFAYSLAAACLSS